MGNAEFDELLCRAIAKRCITPMAQDMASRVMEKQRIRRRRMIWAWIPIAAATIAAMIVVADIPEVENHGSEQRQSEAAPAFYVEADTQAKLRIKNSSATSARLRKDIDEFYIPLQQ